MNNKFTSRFANSLALIVSLFFISPKAQAQCITSTAGPYIMPSTTWQTIALNDVQYLTFDAQAGCQYTFSFCQQGGSYMWEDPYLTISDMFDNPLAANDDWCGLGSELMWTCPSTGMYKIHNANFTCVPGPDTRVLAYWSSCDPPACSGMPVAGTSTSTATTFACEGSANLSLTGYTFGSGLQYQWEYSTDGGTNWFALGSVQTNPAISSGTITQTTQFHCIVTCTNSSQSATSTPVTVTVTGPNTGVTTAVPLIICNGGTTTLSLTGGTTTGVNYQWQSSPDNTIYTNISGGTIPVYTTSALTSPTYFQASLTCTVNGLTATSAPILVDTLPSAAPAVNPTSLSVACGSPANLSATPVTGGTIAWYTQLVGGTPVVVGDNVTVFPTATTTYYAENSIQTEIQGINTTGAVIIDHLAETGWDYGGIAASADYIYYTGDMNTGRFNKSDLSGGTSLNFREGFFGDQANGQLWQMSSNWTLGSSFWAFDNFDRLYELDQNLQITGTVVMLSQSIYINYGSFIAPGEGYVLVFDGTTTVFHVDLNTGVVTTLNSSITGFTYYWTNSWASYGWAEFDGTDYHIVFREDWPSNNISRFNVTSSTINVLQAFTNLSNMATIVYDPPTNRMYFHHNGASQFGGTNETLGFVATTSSPGCGNNDRTPVVVTVTPGPTPTITPTGTTNICTGDNFTFTASQGASYQWYLNGNPISGATSMTYSASLAGNYTVQVTSSLGCVGTSVASELTVNAGLPLSVNVVPTPNDTICVGTIVNFNATPTNGGTGPSYQWKKNGVNVGINSSLYTGAGLLDGDVIEVVVTAGTNICTSTPTATSPAITMSVHTNTVPSVTISANPGTTACADDPVTFTPNPTNGGTTPTYQWTVNGINVGTGASYTAGAGTLSSGDVVAVVMTPSLICSSPSTAGANVNMVIDPLVTPAVTIAASSVNVCQGEPVTFTATDNAPGGTYQWYVNGNPSGPNNAVYTYAPGFNDVVTLDFTPPLAGCYDNITVSSNSVGPIAVTPGLPTMATASASTTGTAEGTLVTVYANLFNFNTNFTIDWYINSVFYATTSVPYVTFVKGPGQDVVYGICNNTGSGCYLTATTNTVTIEGWPTSVASTVQTGNIEVYPNPFSKEIVVKGLADGDKVILFNMLGQTLQEWNVEKAQDEYKIQINDMAAGSYLLNIRDKDGNFKDMKKLQKM